MRTSLHHYMQDGANRQARAVLAMLQDFTIEESWDDKAGEYDAAFTVNRWHNCREQGYVIQMRPSRHDFGGQYNIAFYEHRVADSICAICWKQAGEISSFESADFGEKYQDGEKFPEIEFGYGEIMRMVRWIEKRFTNYYKGYIKDKKGEKAND